MANYGVESMLASQSRRNGGTNDRSASDAAVELAPGRKAVSGYLALKCSTGDGGTPDRRHKPSGVAPFKGV